jgi:transposase
MDTSTVVVGFEKVGRRKVQRRSYTLVEKRRVVAEACARGASVAEVARRHGLNANLVFTWRRQEQQGVLEEHTREAKLLPVQVAGPVAREADAGESGAIRDDGRLEIEFGEHIRVSIIGYVAAERIEHVLALLRRSA